MPSAMSTDKFWNEIKSDIKAVFNAGFIIERTKCKLFQIIKEILDLI